MMRMKLSAVRRKAKELREELESLDNPVLVTLQTHNLRPDGEYYQTQEKLRRLKDKLETLRLPPL